MKTIFSTVAPVLLLLTLCAFQLPEAYATGPTPPFKLSSTGGWAPSITYSGKWFAYDTPAHSIYVGLFDGSTSPSLITANGSHCQIGDYGIPGGNWAIVWTRYIGLPEGYQGDIFAYDDKLSLERQMTTTSWLDDFPSIVRSSAYSYSIAFTSWIDGSNPQICESNFATPSFTQLTSEGLNLWPSHAGGIYARIAFDTIPPGESDHEIAVWSTTGTLRLTYNDIDDNPPSISDDGSKVVWHDANNIIWRAYSDGSDRKQIGIGEDPEISGDGKFVVFTDDRTGNNEVYIVSWDTGEVGGIWNLSQSDADDSEPSISSLTDDGTYHIVFSSDRTSIYDYEIYGCTFVPPQLPYMYTQTFKISASDGAWSNGWISFTKDGVVIGGPFAVYSSDHYFVFILPSQPNDISWHLWIQWPDHGEDWNGANQFWPAVYEKDDSQSLAKVRLEEPIPHSNVGGIVVPLDKLTLLAPYIGLASIAIVAVAATAVYIKRDKPARKKQ